MPDPPGTGVGRSYADFSVPGLPPEERRRTSTLETAAARYVVHGGKHSACTQVDRSLLDAVDGIVLEGSGRALGPKTIDGWRDTDPQYRAIIRHNLNGPRRPVFLGDVPLYRFHARLLQDYRSALIAEKVASFVVPRLCDSELSHPTVFIEYGVGHTVHSDLFQESIEGFLQDARHRRRFLRDRLAGVYADVYNPVSRFLDRVRGRSPVARLEMDVPELWEVCTVTFPPGTTGGDGGDRRAYHTETRVLAGLRSMMRAPNPAETGEPT